MKQCIQHCLDWHPICKPKTFKPEFVPRRLLDLEDGESASRSARLVERGRSLPVRHVDTQDGCRLQYATLSYCWGNSLPKTTTKATKYEHETKGIDIQSMPATFQDAIYVARKLGIRYLWIDALCIVQDDMDEWEAEAVAMCDVFAHSQITISAAKSSSPLESFLQRPVDERLTLRFRSTLKPDIFGEYFLRLNPRYLSAHYFSEEEPDVKNSAWASRAWVWQEEAISTRQIVFGEKASQFRCNMMNVLEDGRLAGLFPERMPVLLSDPTFSWTQVLEAYSSRDLTYPKDRLKAMAGVAECIASSLRAQGKPADYLAGLWKDDQFPNQLCWICEHPTLSRAELMELLRDREKYIAPSWSWASRNSGVVYTRIWSPSSEIQVIEWDLKASHANAMVSVAFGSSITLCGKCWETSMELHSSCRLQAWAPSRLGNPPIVWTAFNPRRDFKFWLDWVSRVQDPEHIDLPRRLLLLFTSVGYSYLERSWTTSTSEGFALGLVLLPVYDLGQMFYYRVGVFEFAGDIRWVEQLPKSVISIQ